ncbi:MAG: ATP-dependent DNA ligase [Candidatus Aenigmarchaeota archaeon]|nr:ATP-dependent DNA ligase [Candidatus Aenigmarchaeota archaeon]
MKYSILCDSYEVLESIPSKLSKADILAKLFSETHSNELPKIVLLAQGMVFPKFSGNEPGVAIQIMMKAISKTTGFTQQEVENKFKKTGDLGLTVEQFIKNRKQSTLSKKMLTIDNIFNNIQQLSFMSGHGSQDRKLNLIAELLVSASPKEAKYIVRTILEELRVGVGEGIIRDAIVKAFLVSENTTKEEKNEITKIVENAWCIFSDFGQVAKIAKEDGIQGLKRVKIQIGNPVQVMLGEKAESIKEVFDKFEKLTVEFKYDGMRAQIHKKNKDIWIFTRRLENVTKQFPDLVELCKRSLMVDECIIEGEVLGIDPKTKLPLTFQKLSQRIHRKYYIEQISEKIPIQMNVFDVLYVDGKMILDKEFKERRNILKGIIKEIPDKFKIASQIITNDIKEAEIFYKKSLKEGQEGVFLKVPSSKYVFGRRVDGWYKIKPNVETLDLVIIGATWGTGKRVGVIGSYILGCRDEETGDFLECGMLGSGVKEKENEKEHTTLKDLTKLLKPYIVSDRGVEIKIKPKIIISVDYQEIQKSSNYKSGFALRFPRFVSLRNDKGLNDVDTLDRINKLYRVQKK